VETLTAIAVVATRANDARTRMEKIKREFNKSTSHSVQIAAVTAAAAAITESGMNFSFSSKKRNKKE
jgi:hypothetical protein